MKKSTLALSIAAAIGGLGLAGNALAVTGAPAGADATKIAVNPNGIGHKLLFPYFTAQNGNATLLTITNTDTTNGKLVKVRFRGAANSDDLYDFQVALSPGDIWTAAVTKDAASGKAMLDTGDNSCTVPAAVKGTFNTDRVDGKAAAQTLEGYVEVINMANIPNPGTLAATTAASALFTAIKHKDGKAPCTAAVIADKLGTDFAAGDASTRGLAAPTTGLTGDWIILNQNTTAAWSGSATALEARKVVNSNDVAALGNVVFWPQTATAPTDGTNPLSLTALAERTADPLLTTGIVKAMNFDLPDMSTPYVLNMANAALQADHTTEALAVKSIANQYATETIINGVTDILFSQPMRRYSAAVNYTASTITDSNSNTFSVPFATNGTRAQAIYRGADESVLAGSTTIANVTYNYPDSDTNLATAIGAGSKYYGPSTATASATQAANLAIPSGQRNLCLYSINGAGNNTIFDREETTPAVVDNGSTVSFVISPNTPAPGETAKPVLVCGEAAVVSINNGSGATASGALSAAVALSDISASSLTSYQAGWIFFDTDSSKNVNGLPILGGSFLRASNGAVNYGFHYSNKVTR